MHDLYRRKLSVRASKRSLPSVSFASVVLVDRAIDAWLRDTDPRTRVHVTVSDTSVGLVCAFRSVKIYTLGNNR